MKQKNRPEESLQILQAITAISALGFFGNSIYNLSQPTIALSNLLTATSFLIFFKAIYRVNNFDQLFSISKINLFERATTIWLISIIFVFLSDIYLAFYQIYIGQNSSFELNIGELLSVLFLMATIKAFRRAAEIQAENQLTI